MLNWHQSGSSFLANFSVVSMSSSVSSGKPSINEQATCIPCSLQSLNAVSVCSSVIFLLMRCRMRGEPDSTPNHMALHPAFFISARSSRETKLTRVSHTHSRSSLFCRIRVQSSIVCFLLRVKLSFMK